MWQLITIPFSHFCEKARWALELSKIPYQEKAYVPGMHLLGTRLRGRGRSVPVLVAGEKCLTDSTDILQFLDAQNHVGPKLYPATSEGRPTVAQLEDWCDKDLGPKTRLFAYHYLLAEPWRLTKLVGESFSWPERVVFRATLPYVGPGITKAYKINPASAERAKQKIIEVFKRADELLADTNAYLAGDHFSAADLSFAALAAPVLMLSAPAPRMERTPTDEDLIKILPTPYWNLVTRLRDTAAGAHCKRIYAEWHR